MNSDMNNLVNLHGKYFENFNFWACETCAEIGWSPQFSNRNEIEMHINKVHINTKINKISIDNKIDTIIDTIIEYDGEFHNSIDKDFDEGFEKVKYFIGFEENLKNLDDTNFKFLINQIKTFYLETQSYESLVNYNYKIHFDTDIITGNNAAFIIESDVANVNFDIKSKDEDRVSKTPEENDPYKKNTVENMTNDNISDIIKDTTEIDVELACDGKQLDFTKSMNYIPSENLNEHLNDKDNNKLESSQFYSNYFDKLLKVNNKNKYDGDIEKYQDKLQDVFIYCTQCDYKSTSRLYMKWHIESFHEEIIFNCDQCDFSSQFEIAMISHRNAFHIIFQASNVYDDSINNKESSRDNFVNQKTISSSRKERFFQAGKSYSLNNQNNDMVEHDFNKKIKIGDKQVDAQQQLQNEDIDGETCENLFKANSDCKEFVSIETICEKSIAMEILDVYKEKEKISLKDNANYTNKNLFSKNDHDTEKESAAFEMERQEKILKIKKKNKYGKCDIKKEMKCDECEYKSKNRDKLKTHIKIVHEGLLYKCDKCEFKSNTKVNITIHVKTTHQELPYTCDQCEYKLKHIQEGIILNVKHLTSFPQDLTKKFKDTKRRKRKSEWKKRKKKQY